MSVSWTEEQLKVLKVRNKNVLVSAAAGSGKTAVLVERILKLVIEEKIDIDNLLVVTYTEAAAGEMRERILKALEAQAKATPWDDHIQKQVSYVHNASITTIHSFCLNIVRQYFNEIDIDPSFRVGDEGELSLIKQDVLKELLEDWYSKNDKRFIDFVDNYASGSSKNDRELEAYIFKLFGFAMSHPNPEKWLRSNVNFYDTSSGIEDKPWYAFLSENADNIFKSVLKKMEEAIELTLMPDGPNTYEEALRIDYNNFLTIYNAKDFDKRVKMFREFKHETLSRKKMQEGVDDSKKDRVKAIRDEIKAEVGKLKEKYYYFELKDVKEEIDRCRESVSVLVELVIDFIHRYNEAKQEKNVIDFDDMEHLALRILTKENESGEIEPTMVAKEIAEDFYEIMIDEYQDSNLVQETILKSISGGRNGVNNLFMVGDVKQSIYKFRMAKPELFLEKYHSYDTDEAGINQRISLTKNFRSRKEVLDGANAIFQGIMQEEIGGIEYDEDNALHPGAKYDDYGVDYKPELMIVDTEDKDDELSEVAGIELEPYMVAKRIKEMMASGYPVWDKSIGKKRPLKYSDIVILLRSYGDRGQAYNDILSANGIPVKGPASTGYFDSFEVVQILNMLTVIDNPLQDIPLTSVMKHIYAFSEDELADIKSHGTGNERYFYECVAAAAEDEKGTDKVRQFVSQLEQYRNMSTYTSISELIDAILDDTGFAYYVSAMKAGEVRSANIEMLRKKASDYENTSYRGLFHFVRYIELLKKFNIEQGEADVVGGGDCVTLMTIHKSKGLEFPMVFLAALCKRRNKQDITGNIIMHQELGIGIKYMDRSSAIKADTLIKNCIAEKIEDEGIAEELRVLYVALTRAREKLIMVGTCDANKRISKYDFLSYMGQKRPDISEICRCNDYMEWVLMTVLRNKSLFNINIVKPEVLIAKKAEEKIFEEGDKQSYLKWDSSHVYDSELRDTIRELYSFEYPYSGDKGLSAKVSVSDIKHTFMKMYDEDTIIEGMEVKGFDTEDKPVPEFIRKKEEAGGALRGTAYHRVYELLDYVRLADMETIEDIIVNVEKQINEMVDKGYITPEYQELINPSKVAGIMNINLGKRMMKAALAGKLYREKQFVIGVPANYVKEEYSKEETVLIQGIVDAYFEEEGEIVIVDYKTDKVNNIKDLKARYETQLKFYDMAISRITGKRVKERILYSVGMNQELSV